MPWLYHHYVGHDNNRDWFMLTPKETRALSRMVYHDCFPQTFVDQHQMGSIGSRMFIPPFSDPLDVDVHPLNRRRDAEESSESRQKLLGGCAAPHSAA